MIIVLSGEGPTDIGTCNNRATTCDSPVYVRGAMGLIVDVLIEPIWTYSPYDSCSMHFLSESELARLSDKAKIVSLPGKKKAKGTAYFFKNSYALGNYAKNMETNNDCETMAVLFRDSDGTRSTQKGLWADKVNSMTLGFLAADYARGVPMVPKPKSEAWLLCAVQEHPYQNCTRFESISGNDRSPSNAKKQLEDALAPAERTHLCIPDMINDGEISPARINMPSFNAFRERLEEVARAMVDLPSP